MRIDASTLSSAYSGYRTTQTRSSATSALAQASTDDSSTISSQGFAALLAERSGSSAEAPPKLTDEQAAEFGQRMQEEDPDLFAQVDTDSDGTLTAQEMEDGKDAIQSVMQAKGGPGGPGGAGGPGGPPPGPPPGEDDSEDDDSTSATTSTSGASSTTSTLLDALNETLKANDQELFSALDSDEDGTVSVSELSDLIDGGNDSASGSSTADQLRTNLLRDLLSPLLSASSAA